MSLAGILACDMANPQGPAAPWIPRGWQGAQAQQSRDPALHHSYCFIYSGINFWVSNLSHPLKKEKRKAKRAGGWERKKLKDYNLATQASRSMEASANNLLCQKEVVIIKLTLFLTKVSNPNSLLTRYVEFYL
jgi:hypothetical protein